MEILKAAAWRARFLVCVFLSGSCVPAASPARSAPHHGAPAPPPTLATLGFGGGEPAELEADRLARRWAPLFVQHTSIDHPERDRPLPIDFDGDWDATNNWSHLTPAAARAAATVYFSAILTETHAYLTYTLFYPRDWVPFVCMPYICHDNDLEVALVVVEREPGDGGKSKHPVLVETKTHRDYVAVTGPELALGEQDQPVIRIQSQGHGMYAARLSSRTTSSDTVRLVSRSNALPSGSDREERYELVPIRETLWARRHATAEGGRLWAQSESGRFDYTGTRFGQLGSRLGALMAISDYRGGVRPPWALAAGQARGDWFIDPALETLSRNRGAFSGRPTSSRYVFNPYLEDLASECSGRDCSRPALEPAAAASLSGLGVLSALGMLFLRLGARPNAGSRRAPQPRRRP